MGETLTGEVNVTTDPRLLPKDPPYIYVLIHREFKSPDFRKVRVVSSDDDDLPHVFVLGT